MEIKSSIEKFAEYEELEKQKKLRICPCVTWDIWKGYFLTKEAAETARAEMRGMNMFRKDT